MRCKRCFLLSVIGWVESEVLLCRSDGEPRAFSNRKCCVTFRYASRPHRILAVSQQYTMEYKCAVCRSLISRCQRPVWKRLHEYARKEPVKHDLVREEIHEGRTVYLCSCGLGYDDPLIAFACEEYARTYRVNSEEIIKRAVYNPRSARRANQTIATP